MIYIIDRKSLEYLVSKDFVMSFNQDVSNSNSFSVPLSVAIFRSPPRGCRDILPA